jgi:hypothetical protein
MSQEDYNPNSIDSRLTEIKTLLSNHISETRAYRKAKDTADAKLADRVTAIEGDKKKFIGFIAGASAASGSVGALVAKYFGSGGSGH